MKVFETMMNLICKANDSLANGKIAAELTRANGALNLNALNLDALASDAGCDRLQL